MLSLDIPSQYSGCMSIDTPKSGRAQGIFDPIVMWRLLGVVIDDFRWPRVMTVVQVK